ncbi:protein of unknown function [Legionella fallonii LLAP-10]|uniref:Uncharacterized protein n=1 Tax=Legionella fallonii LLAP-10 TaxID=1212491 RepID=A0A098G0R4_9GAMM|nr:protein of unknown function [Legionella fallonii LLAP-10]
MGPAVDAAGIRNILMARAVLPHTSSPSMTQTVPSLAREIIIRIKYSIAENGWGEGLRRIFRS